MPLSVVILAAGQGKRMKSDLPKVLQPLAGRPLLAHVIDAARARWARRPSTSSTATAASGARGRCTTTRCDWALQAEQLGTGHAVMQAMPGVADDALVLVLYGDVPLVRPETLRAAGRRGRRAHARAALGADDDPTGYGRIVRDRGGRVVRIVEQKDATTKERAIHEINTGLMAAPAALLRGWLGRSRTTTRRASTT